MNIAYLNRDRKPSQGDVKTMKDGRVFVRVWRMTQDPWGKMLLHVQHGRPVHDWRLCNCYTCLDDPSLGWRNPTMCQMVMCKFCGNKRCPHSTHHDLECTQSNEPGQKGSRY